MPRINSATPPPAPPQVALHGEETATGSADGRFVRRRRGVIEKKLHSAQKGAKKRVRKLKRTIAKTGKKLTHLPAGSGVRRASGAKRTVSMEALHDSLSELEIVPAKGKSGKKRGVSRRVRGALRRIGGGSHKERKAGVAKKKSPTFEAYPESFAADFLNNKKVAPHLARYQAKSVGDMRKDLQGLLVQDVATHVGTEAARKIAQGERVSTAAPGLSRAAQFETALDGCSWHENMAATLQEIESAAAALESGTLAPEEKQAMAEKLARGLEEAALVQEKLGEAMVAYIGDANANQREASLNFLLLARALSDKVATQHMRLADLQAHYGDYLPPAQGRLPGLQADLFQARTYARAVGSMAAESTHEAWPMLKGALAEHSAALEMAVAREAGKKQAGVHELLLAAPARAVRPSAANDAAHAEAMQAMQSLWREKQAGRAADKPWLPLNHPVLSQKEMMEGLLAFGREEMGLPLPGEAARGMMLAREAHAVRNQAQWPESARPVSFYRENAAYNYTARMSPAGNQLAPQFEAPYQGGINAEDKTQHRHVRNLAYAALEREDGSAAVRTLRHAALDPSAITPDYLRHMPPAELKTLLQEAYWDETRATPDIPNAASLAYHCATKAGNRELASICRVVRDKSAALMAQELVSAALLADPHKSARALRGVPVEVALNEISLLTPGLVGEGPRAERTMLKRQAAALKTLADAPQPIRLQIRDKGGAMKEVEVNFRLRQFNFGVDDKAHRLPLPMLRNLAGWGYSAEINHPALADLAGPAREEGLGGAIGVRLAGLREELIRLHGMRDELTGSQSADDPAPPPELAALDRQISATQRQFNLFFQCGHQVKQIWRQGAFRASGAEAYALAARIAVLSHMLGETPALSDANGMDRTGPLDAEVKQLAAYMDVHGVPPSLEAPPAPEQAALRQRLLIDNGEQALRQANYGTPA